MPRRRANRSQTSSDDTYTVAWKDIFICNLGLPKHEFKALRRAFLLKITDGSRTDLERIIAGALPVRGIGPKVPKS